MENISHLLPIFQIYYYKSCLNSDGQQIYLVSDNILRRHFLFDNGSLFAKNLNLIKSLQLKMCVKQTFIKHFTYIYIFVCLWKFVLYLCTTATLIIFIFLNCFCFSKLRLILNLYYIYGQLLSILATPTIYYLY